MPCSSSVSPACELGLARAPRSSPRRCTANMTRSPLSVTIPGNTVWPISRRSGAGSTTSASPDVRLKSVVREVGGGVIRPEGEALVGRQAAAAVCALPRTIRTSPSASAARPQRAARRAAWTATSSRPGIIRQVDGRRRHARRTAMPARTRRLEDPVVEPVLLDQGAGVPAEVGRHRPAAAMRQQTLAEQEHDHDRAERAAAPRRGRTRRTRRRRPPHRRPASDTITFTGEPVSASSDPACAAKPAA